jgi:hypothetical protein
MSRCNFHGLGLGLSEVPTFSEKYYLLYLAFVVQTHVVRNAVIYLSILIIK